MRRGEFKCNFCDRKFQSGQGVRAHLRWCEVYAKGEPEEEGLMDEDAHKERNPRAQPRNFDPVDHMRQQVQTEEQRLRLREIRSIHNELDKKERREVGDSHREGEVARGRVEEDREKERRERREREERRRYREIIQRVKQRVMTLGREFRWSLVGIEITPEIKAKILVEIERELSSLPDGLSENELVTIAEGVVDHFYQTAVKAKEEKEAEKTAARRGRLRALEEAETQKQRMSQLISHADSYAGEQLEDFPPLDRMDILGQVRKAVAEEIDGSETQTQVENLTDEILDDFLPEDEEEEG